MSGYTPIFDSVFHGSLCGKFPDLPLWLVLLALADKNGDIDCHPSYIATVSGISQDLVESCIARFCEPDPSSRTPDHDGRRLLPIDGRGFGWRVINHSKYREKARKMAFDQARQADGRNAERMRERREANKTDPTRPDATRDDPPSYSDANTNTNSEKKKKPASRGCSLPEEFGLTEDRKAYAEKTLQNVDAAELMAAFRDYHAGKGTVGKDWDAYWRNYVRNALKFGYPMLPLPPQAPRGKREPTPEQISEAQRLAAEDNKRQLQKALGSAFK